MVGVLQWLLFAAMLAGVIWLTGLFALDYLRFPEPPTPTNRALPRGMLMTRAMRQMCSAAICEDGWIDHIETRGTIP